MNKRDEAVLEEFREKFGMPEELYGDYPEKIWGYGKTCKHDGLVACGHRLAVIESWLLQKLQEERERVVKEIEKSLPEEIGESEGWDLAFESCCGGDDTAHGWNHCRKVVLKKLSIIKSK